jgi:hypothetical protein
MNITKSQVNVDKKITMIKEKIAQIGEMRPGRVSRQYNVCGNPRCRCKDPINPKKHGPYYQLSYVHEGKSTSRFIKRPLLKQVLQETREYKKFKALTDQWIKLAIKMADLRLKSPS